MQQPTVMAEDIVDELLEGCVDEKVLAEGILEPGTRWPRTSLPRTSWLGPGSGGGVKEVEKAKVEKA